MHERAAGQEIHPARPASQQTDTSQCKASRICAEIGDEGGKLAW